MTSVGNVSPRVFTPSASQPSRVDHLRPEDRDALCRDLLQPYVVDYSCFSNAIAAEAARFWGRPRMIDLACGTGALAMPILAAARDLDYHGFDPSEADVRLFRPKTVRLEQPRRIIDLSAPVDPRRQDIPLSRYGGTAELVLMVNFLQYAPLAIPADGRYNQVGLLGLLRRLLRPGGKLFIIEEVLGERADDETAFTIRWNQVMANRIGPVFDTNLAPVLWRLDPELEKLARTARAQPQLWAAVRERLHREPVRERLPLSAWTRIFDHLGWRYSATRHEKLEQFYLFTIQA